jgi:hypothetical protein
VVAGGAARAWPGDSAALPCENDGFSDLAFITHTVDFSEEKRDAGAAYFFGEEDKETWSTQAVRTPDAKHYRL